MDTLQLMANFLGQQGWPLHGQVEILPARLQLSVTGLSWVLNIAYGEKRFKSLKVSKIDDVSFSGSTSIQVAAGSADRLGPNMRTFFSEAFFVPEPLNPGGGIPDITIIRLNTNISFTNNLQPIRLPNREWGNFDYAGWEFNIMGFGGDNSGGLARILQYGYFRVHTSGACNFQQWEFCGLASRNSITSTQGGDSGKLSWILQVCNA